MRTWLCLLVICLSLVSTEVLAELTYSELEHSYKMTEKDQTQVLDNYLLGLYEGINAANLAYMMQNKQYLYCKPPEFDLNVTNIRGIISKTHEEFDTGGEIPVSYLLFVGLNQTFPCF